MAEFHSTQTISIVGGGLAGLLSGLMWARAGYSVQLWGVDSKLILPPSRTVALLEKSVTWLEKIGVWRRVALHAQTLHHMHIMEGKDKSGAAFIAENLGRKRWAEHIALQHLKEGVLAVLAEYPKVEMTKDQVQAIEKHEKGVCLTTKKGIKSTSNILIGADGKNSIVRAFSGIRLQHWQKPIGVMTGLLTYKDKLAQEYAGQTLERYGEGELQTIVSLPGEKAALLWLGRTTTLQKLAEYEESVLRQHLHRKINREVFASFSYDGVMTLPFYVAEKLSKRNVMLLGEAAHGFPPIAAQGLNLTIRGIRKLERGLQDGVSLEHICKWYQRHHYGEVLRTCGKVAVLTDLVLPSSKSWRGRARGLAIGYLGKHPFLKALAVRAFDGA